MTPKLERIIHEESLPGALFEGYDRTLTYKIDKNGKLKCYQFVGEGCCLNNEREITRNPLYDALICNAGILGLSTVIGAGFGAIIGAEYGLIGQKIELGLVAGLVASSIMYLLSLPLGAQISADFAADKLAWDKYQSSRKLTIVKGDEK